MDPDTETIKSSLGTKGKLRSCPKVVDPDTYKLPDMIIALLAVPFNALIILRTWSALMTAPG